MTTLENINNSLFLYRKSETDHIREYHAYCVSLIRDFLLNYEGSINFILGRYEFDFQNELKTIKADIQFEHTIVKQGGRGSDGFPKGKVLDSDGNEYLVRISDYNYLSTRDIVIEYSFTNIENIKSSGIFDEYATKLRQVTPILYDHKIEKGERTINCITSFSNIYEERRYSLIKEIERRGIDSKNVNDVFSGTGLKDLYSETRILINIRQTNHHHTLEELRVLPALLNGVIVVCEDVPLRESVPYQDFVIWSDYSNILDKVQEVQDNYDFYWDSIFGNGRFDSAVEKMKQENIKSINEIVDNEDRKN